MASALDMVAGVGQFGFDPLADIYEGRKTRFSTNEMNRADQARPLMGQALQGDTNALNSLAGIDPQGFMAVSQYQQKDPATEAARVARLIEWGDTPEKWQKATQRIQGMGHQLEPQELDFNNRGVMLAEYQATQKGEAFTLGEGQMRFGPSGKQIAAGPPKSPGTSSTVVTDIGGQRGILDKTTGEFRPLGRSPVRGRPGLTATELKFQRESEGDQLNLEQTIASLKQAATLAPDVFEGFGASTLSQVGSKMPGAGMLGIDTGKANKTAQFTSIMSPEAIKTMAETLKGATTDFELRKFENILSDPSQPNNIKQQVIDRMLTLAVNKYELETRRLQEFERGDEQVPPAEIQGSGEIPTQAVEELLADPGGAAEFDEIFGPGAAARVLGQQ